MKAEDRKILLSLAFHGSDLSAEEAELSDRLSEEAGQEGFTVDRDGNGNIILRAYDDQDDVENDIFPQIG